MHAVQTNEQQMKQMGPRVDAEHPPKKPPGQAIGRPCPRERTALLIFLSRMTNFFTARDLIRDLDSTVFA
jgi:hypothetical protein